MSDEKLKPCPTPWDIDPHPAEGDRVQVVDAIGGKVCEMDGHAEPSRMNAELIVRSVNRFRDEVVDEMANVRLDYEARCRRWYYRLAVLAFRRIMENFFRESRRIKGSRAYLMAMLEAAAKDAEVAHVLIERDGDGLNFRNHERDPKTKLIVRCECYLK